MLQQSAPKAIVSFPRRKSKIPDLKKYCYVRLCCSADCANLFLSASIAGGEYEAK